MRRKLLLLELPLLEALLLVDCDGCRAVLLAADVADDRPWGLGLRDVPFEGVFCGRVFLAAGARVLDERFHCKFSIAERTRGPRGLVDLESLVVVNLDVRRLQRGAQGDVGSGRSRRAELLGKQLLLLVPFDLALRNVYSDRGSPESLAAKMANQELRSFLEHLLREYKEKA